MTGATLRCDVAVTGGGMVGLSLAASLAGLPLEVAVIEPVAPDADEQPSFDSRTTALSSGSRHVRPPSSNSMDAFCGRNSGKRRSRCRADLDGMAAPRMALPGWNIVSGSAPSSGASDFGLHRA